MSLTKPETGAQTQPSGASKEQLRLCQGRSASARPRPWPWGVTQPGSVPGPVGQAVNKELESGWKLQGWVFCCVTSGPLHSMGLHGPTWGCCK